MSKTKAEKGKQVKGSGQKEKGKEKAPASKFKGPGVVAAILEIISKKGPISKGDILTELCKRFPEREADKMKATISTQLSGRGSCRLAREKKVEFKIEEGRYSLKK